MMRLSLRSLAALVSLAAGCADDPAPTPPIDFAFCPTQHVDGAVVVCDVAFADAPRIHLPADDGDTVYAAVGGAGLVDRTRAPVTFAGVAFDVFADPASMPSGFALPSYEFLERVYAVRGTSATPVVRLAPEVIDGNLFGTWEGTISTQLTADTYDQTMRVPLRVTLDRFAAEHHDLHRWNPYDAGDPVLTYALRVQGTIANATTPITLADGTCAPTIGYFGDSVELMREVAMHVPGDTQLLFQGWMGAIDFATPAALIDVAPDATATYTAYPHGTPNGQHLDDLRRVTGGGAACTP
ncbi:MAG: hypothetical protein NT062_04015 [Proteobacteria bacterium]|nr:hypothetical protein [Pseudomonadota bacterium]